MIRSASGLNAHELTGEQHDLAHRCEKLYTLYRSEFEHHMYRPHPCWSQSRTLSIWQRLALFIARHGVDPELFFKAIFAGWRSPRAPLPNQLLGDVALKLYQEATGNLEQELRIRLDLEQDLCQDEMYDSRRINAKVSRIQLERAILLRQDLALDSLFRYCMAVKCGYEDIAERYYKRAVMEYVPSRDLYDAIWGKLLPAGFRREAPRAYEHYLLGKGIRHEEA